MRETDGTAARMARSLDREATKMAGVTDTYIREQLEKRRDRLNAVLASPAPTAPSAPLVKLLGEVDSALQRLAERLGIAREETMAIGDNWNDEAMLDWAGVGVLMGNATEELRALAPLRGWYMAPANSADGVAVMLEKAVAGFSSATLR